MATMTSDDPESDPLSDIREALSHASLPIETLREASAASSTWIGVFPSGRRRELTPDETALLNELDPDRSARDFLRIEALRQEIIQYWQRTTPDQERSVQWFDDLGALLGGDIWVEREDQAERMLLDQLAALQQKPLRDAPEAPQPVLDQDTPDQVIQALTGVVMQRLGWARPIAEALARGMYPNIQRSYRAVGSPYGPAAADMLRWLDEQTRREG